MNYRPENDAASVAGSQPAVGSVKSERGGNNNTNNTAATTNNIGEREGGVKRERVDQQQGQQQPQGKRMKTER